VLFAQLQLVKGHLATGKGIEGIKRLSICSGIGFLSAIVSASSVENISQRYIIIIGGRLDALLRRQVLTCV